MGIPQLNKHFQQYGNNAIKQISLSELRNKKIVIDTSIYMYKFITCNALLENFYLMITIFKQYNIIPLFVFDGKPPPEKNELLWIRKKAKQKAEFQFNELKKILENTENGDEKKDIVESMDCLKKKFIRMNHRHIQKVKSLMESCGISYIEAPKEADELCASLVIKNKAYACLSEDMDLFVYGCPRVLRYFSLLNNNVILYDTKVILENMKMDFKEFQQICVLSSNDYNVSDKDKYNLHMILKQYEKYKKHSQNFDSFIEYIRQESWLKVDFEDFQHVLEIFKLGNKDYLQKYNNISIINSVVHKENLKTILSEENFIFAY